MSSGSGKEPLKAFYQDSKFYRDTIYTAIFIFNSSMYWLLIFRNH